MPRSLTATHDGSGPGASRLVVFNHFAAIHQHQAESGRILMRFLKRGVVLNLDRIEDNEVRPGAFTDDPAVFDAKSGGIGRYGRDDLFAEQ